MIQIRNSVFETNSSSSHSISILKEDRVLTADEIKSEFYCNNNNRIHLWNMNFGRRFDLLASFRDKLEYVIASYGDEEDIVDRMTELLQNLVPEFKENNVRLKVDKDDYYGYGSVDHQSMNVLNNFLTEHDLSIEDFLTHTRYIVWIDGDEYKIKDKFFDSNIVKKDSFEEV